MRVYLRKTPMIYTIINAHQKKDPDTGILQTIQGIYARFTNNFPGQVARYDPQRFIDNWINNEKTSGRLEVEELPKKKKWLEGVVQDFIEKHPDFQTGVIYYEPTKEDIKKSLEAKKALLEKEIESLGEALDSDIPDDVVKEVQENAAKKVDPSVKVKGGGVSRGSTTSTARGQ